MPTPHQIVEELRRRQLAARATQIDPGSAPGIPELDRVRTRDQAERNTGEVDDNLESGPAHMQLAMDVLNPIDASVGIATGGMKAAGQGLRALGKGAVEGMLGGAAERQNVIDLVNSGKDLAPTAKGMIKDTMQGITEKGIKPKDAALRELLQGKTGQINPDLVRDTFPNYAKRLMNKREQIPVEVPNVMTRGAQQEIPLEGLGSTTVMQAAPQGAVDVSGTQLLRLKRAADKAAGYSKSAAPFQEAAASRNASARQLADVARDQIYQQAPGSQEILSDMGRDIKLRKFLGKKSESDPVGLLKSKAGTTKDSVLASADNVAGTNLRGYGDKIESAVDLQMRPKNLVNPLGVAPELRKMATRGLIKGGAVAHDAAEGVGKALGAARAPEALGYAGAREAVSDALPEENKTGIDRARLLQSIKDELNRRSGN